MFRRTLIRTYDVDASIDEAWRYFSDPVAMAAESTHPIRVEDLGPEFVLGTTWTEHHDADCDFDVVPWSVVAIDPPRSVTIEGWQAGARLRATTTLEQSAAAVQVSNTLELRPALRDHGTLVERVLIFAVLATNLGMSIVAGEFEQGIVDDMAHFGLEPVPDDEDVDSEAS